LGWTNTGGWLWVFVALLLGLSAGVFEELARYLVLRRISKRVSGWSEGLLFGLGHGGLEAIIVAGFAFYALFQALALRGVPLEGLLPAARLETARAQLESYWGMVWYEPLWATLERISALAFHTMAALLVLIAVRQRRLGWLAAAILAHTLFNAVALVSVRVWGVATTEAILAGMGAVCVWVLFRLRSVLVVGPGTDPSLAQSAAPPQPKTKSDGVEAERIEESRFL